MNIAAPYAPATATAPKEIPAILAFWLEEELLPELFSNTSPPLPLDVEVLLEPPADWVVVDPSAPSPRVMPMAELICWVML